MTNISNEKLEILLNYYFQSEFFLMRSKNKHVSALIELLNKTEEEIDIFIKENAQKQVDDNQAQIERLQAEQESIYIKNPDISKPIDINPVEIIK